MTTANSQKQFQAALESSWSLQSSSLWQKGNPALGQCGVTALVAQDILGGEIIKTKYGDIWHFYNHINGEVIDFTRIQFDEPVHYTDLVSSRAEAFGDTDAQQYDYLSSAVQKSLIFK
ncbi:MAG: hypothetical protein V3V13_09670 [Paracoccaceae bacterium]